jgi:hypothetical protein
MAEIVVWCFVGVEGAENYEILHSSRSLGQVEPQDILSEAGVSA